MSMKHTGAKRKRSNTPAENRKRVVAYRHVRFDDSFVSRKQESGEKTDAQPVVVLEKQKDKTELIKPVKKDEVKQKPEKKAVSKEKKKEKQDAPVTAKKTGKEKRKEKKERKAAALEEEINHYIDTPRTGFFTKLLDPLKAARTEASVTDETVASFGLGLVILFLNWLAVMGVFLKRVRILIDLNQFGTARLNFSQSAEMSAKLALYLFVGELLMYLIFSLLSFTTSQRVSFKKLTVIAAQPSLASTVVAVIGYFLLDVNTALGVSLAIASIVICLLFKASAISMILKVNSKVKFLLIIVLSAILLTEFFSFASSVLEPLVKIFDNILILK